MTEGRSNIDVIAHQVDQLEKSDSSQWDHIRQQAVHIQELHFTRRLVKIGVVSVVALFVLVMSFVRGGWDAVLAMLAR